MYTTARTSVILDIGLVFSLKNSVIELYQTPVYCASCARAFVTKYPPIQPAPFPVHPNSTPMLQQCDTIQICRKRKSRSAALMLAASSSSSSLDLYRLAINREHIGRASRAAHLHQRDAESIRPRLTDEQTWKGEVAQ